MLLWSKNGEKGIVTGCTALHAMPLVLGYVKQTHHSVVISIQKKQFVLPNIKIGSNKQKYQNKHVKHIMIITTHCPFAEYNDKSFTLTLIIKTDIFWVKRIIWKAKCYNQDIKNLPSQGPLCLLLYAISRFQNLFYICVALVELYNHSTTMNYRDMRTIEHLLSK